MLSYLCYKSNNTKHSMLDYTHNKTVKIYNFDQYFFPKNTLELWLFIIYLYTMVYLEDTAGI